LRRGKTDFVEVRALPAASLAAGGGRTPIALWMVLEVPNNYTKTEMERMARPASLGDLSAVCGW